MIIISIAPPTFVLLAISLVAVGRLSIEVLALKRKANALEIDWLESKVPNLYANQLCD